MGRGLTEEQLLERMENWVEKGNGRRVTGFNLTDYSGETSYSAYRLEDSEGRIKKYVVPNYEQGEGWSWRILNEETYKKYKAGYDIDQRMPNSPLITGPGPHGPNEPLREERERIPQYDDRAARGVVFGYAEGEIKTYTANVDVMRERLEARQRGVPPTEEITQPSPESPAPLVSDNPVLKAETGVEPVPVAAATHQTPVSALNSSAVTVTDNSLGGVQKTEVTSTNSPYRNDQYIDSKQFYDDVSARGNRFFKASSAENGMILEVDSQGQIVRGIERDPLDPTKATVKQGDALSEALDQQGLSIRDAERSAASIFADTEQMQRTASRMAVATPHMAMP
jgi:hypothetical protein